MTLFHGLLAAHVLGVLWWVGGVCMVTGVLLPLFNALPDAERVARIHALEARFANQARLAVLVVGITGFWMLWMTGGWPRLALATGWWIDLMLLVWVAFTLMLFVAEPLGLPRRLGLLHKRRAFWLIHAVLLALALAAVVAGVIGSRGGLY